MSQFLYFRLREHIERRLWGGVRAVTLHALSFALLVTPLALYSALTDPSGIIDGLVYWLAFFWNLSLFLHALLAYRASGAWTPRRERVVAEHVLDAAEDRGLSEDEMIDLHRHLSDDLRLRAAPFARLMVYAGGSLLLWVGTLALMSLLPGLLPGIQPSQLALPLRASLLGTLALSFILPAGILWRRAPGGDDALRAIYGGGNRAKRKHGADVGLSDDGELIYGDEEALPGQKQRG